jgi:hypothetical protein
MSYKKDVEQVARIRDPLDRANAAAVQPMQALIGANVIAALNWGAGWAIALSLALPKRATARSTP